MAITGKVVTARFRPDYPERFIEEGLTILGWVANWWPIEIFFTMGDPWRGDGNYAGTWQRCQSISSPHRILSTRNKQFLSERDVIGVLHYQHSRASNLACAQVVEGLVGIGQGIAHGLRAHRYFRRKGKELHAVASCQVGD